MARRKARSSNALTAAQIRRAYDRIFNTSPDGEVILDDLSAAFFDGNVFHENPYTHAWNSGKRDVIRYIKTMSLPMTREEEEDEDAST